FEGVLAKLVRESETSISEFRVGEELEQKGTKARQETQTIAIAATFTAEPIEEPLRYWMKELDVPTEVQFASYNQVFQELLDPASLLAKNHRGLNVILIRIEDWLRSSNATNSSGAHNGKGR